jgi:hypothetical protein
MKAMSDVEELAKREKALELARTAGSWFDRKDLSLPEREQIIAGMFMVATSDALEAQAAELTRLRNQSEAKDAEIERLKEEMNLANKQIAETGRAWTADRTTLSVENERLRKALDNLLKHIDRIEYRDKAGLRLSDVVPQVEHAREALAAHVGEEK